MSEALLTIQPHANCFFSLGDVHRYLLRYSHITLFQDVHPLITPCAHLYCFPVIMDPFSIVAGVSGICAVTAKLISALSEFVDNVQEAPKEVRALSSDLAAFYNVFTRIRLAIEAPRISPIPDGWKDEFETLTSDCLDTVKQTKKIVDEAVVTTTTSKAQQMWRTVKITFKTKKLEVLRLRLVSQIATVSLSLDCLDEYVDLYTSIATLS